MDIKAIGSVQTALEMNIVSSHEATSHNQEKKQEENFSKLPTNLQHDIIQKNIEKLNEKLKLFSDTMQIEIDKDTGIRVVKFIDAATKEVVKQLPPESVLKIAKYIDEITGLLFDKKV